QAKSAFLAAMGHELKTPLNAVLGFSEIIRDELFGPAGQRVYRDYAADIHASGTRLLALINDILDVSRIEGGAITIAARPEDLDLVIETALAFARRATGDLRSVEIDVERTVGPVNVDASRLGQAL